MRTWLTLISVAASIPLPAMAQPSPTAEERAQAAFGRGQEAAEARDFEAARDHFEESLREFPHAPTAFNLAVVLIEVGACTRSVELFDDLATGNYGEVGSPLRDNVAEQRSRAVECLATLRVTCGTDFPIDVTIEGDPIGEVRRGGVLERRIDPGTVVIEGTAEGAEPSRWELELVRGETRELELVLERAEVVEPPPGEGAAPPPPILDPDPVPPRDDSGTVFDSPWFWVVTGVLVAAGVGVAIGVASYDPGVEVAPPVNTPMFDVIFTR